MRSLPPSAAAAREAPAGGPTQQQRYVQPGQILVAGEPAQATTVLGSCVAVCLWDARLGLGGLNHFVLPESAGGGSACARFGDCATARLIEELGRLGSRREDMSAKLFGGAAPVEALGDVGRQLGARNVGVARRVLAGHGIPILAEDVLGSRGRRLLFHTATGVALVRLI